MKNIKIKDIIIPAAALLVICLVATFLLAGTNVVTQEKIFLNSLEKENSSRSIVLPQGKEYGEVVTLDNGITYCVSNDENGEIVGYVFTSSAKGYGGDVGVMVGLDTEGVITGIEILSHSETPGLGANATSDSFKSNFVGKSGILTVDKNSNDGQNIKAITAATITSSAVTSAVNAVISEFEKFGDDEIPAENAEDSQIQQETESTEAESESTQVAPESTQAKAEETVKPEGYEENAENTAVLPAAKYFGKVTTLESGITYCDGKNEKGENAGYVFTTSGEGYRGEIGVLVGFDTKGVITGIEIISQSETEGIGSNVTNDYFKERFIGKSGTLLIDKNSNEGQNIQAVTSATISSATVVVAVNEAIQELEKIMGGENNG